MTDNLRGILAVLVSSVAFIFNDVCVKLVSDELPSGEIIIVRGVLATAMLAAGVVAMGAMRPLSLLFTPMMLLRLASAAGATVFIVLSLRYLPLATVITVLQVTPLAVTAGAAIIYRERVGLSRWLAALTGFLGVVLIVGPARASAPRPTWRWPPCSSRPRATSPPGSAPRHPLDLRRRRAAPLPSRWPASSSPPSTPPGRCPRRGPGALMTASAACLFVANTAMIMALRTGEIAVIAPFRYAMVPLALAARLLAVGRHPRRHRLLRDRPGAGGRPLYPASRAGRAQRRAAPPPPRNGAPPNEDPTA